MNTFTKRLAKLEQSARCAARRLPRLIVVEPGETKEEAMARLGIEPNGPMDYPDLILQFIEPEAWRSGNGRFDPTNRISCDSDELDDARQPP